MGSYRLEARNLYPLGFLYTSLAVSGDILSALYATEYHHSKCYEIVISELLLFLNHKTKHTERTSEIPEKSDGTDIT